MELTYTIKKSSKRSKLTITVERDRSVVVHVPEGTTDEKIREVVEAKRQWLYEKTGHPQKYQNPLHPPGKELVSGESALYLGRNYRIEVANSGLTEIQFAQCFLVPPLPTSERAAAFRNWYIARANEKMVPRVAHHARQVGVAASAIKIVDNRYRWGSCTPTNTITLNWRLIKAPMFVVDYVIVHELAHLLESNHTQRFWNIIRAQTATMEKAKAWLKENGRLLEQTL